MHNLEVESYILFRNLTEDNSLGNNLSDSSEELFQRGKGEARIYKSFRWKKKCSQTSKDYCKSQKTDISIDDFSAFLCMGRCKSLVL